MSDADSDLEIVGKKVFFLFPTAVIQNRIIDELVQQEYEIYFARDKDTIRRVLRKYNDSIVFVDINEKLNEREWETWIRAVMEAPDTNGVSIGIISANDDEAIKKKYLETIKVKCGYTVLKFDLDKAISQILEVLQTAEAKGRRKFIRASMGSDTNATLNLPMHGEFVKGQIRDISVVGISCTIDGNPEISKNTLFKDIQIKLQSTLLKVEGIVYGARQEGNNSIYVILFTQRTDPEVRTKIRKYIQHTLQIKMDAELK